MLRSRHLILQAAALILCTIVGLANANAEGLRSSDLLSLHSVGDVQFSPDGVHLAYTVENNDGPGRPYSQVWIVSLSDGKSVRIGGEKGPSSNPVWSPDSRWVAFQGRDGDKSGLMIAQPDGSSRKFLSAMQGTNSPLPSTGNTISWSRDGKRIAFIDSVPGPETELASGDPIVITRYLYKPDDSEGLSHFNDNRRLHIFWVDVASGQVQQLTDGTHYEHSIDWSPNGEEIVFVSNREPNEDQFFNYDIFALKVSDRTIRRLTATENAEYRPRWSPDGKSLVYQATKRGLTDLETTMEDTHIWLMDADGRNRRELGGAIDNRQGAPNWAPDGRSVYFTVQERGNVSLYRLPATGGQPEAVVRERGTLGAWAVSKDGKVAYALSTPSNTAQLYVKSGQSSPKKTTDLNAQVLGGKEIAEVESFTFISNDNKYEVEAFLTKPLVITSSSKHPLIVNIHGGPHGQQGPAFNFKNQVYAARGWATLMVNYRGSTGYGQQFADAVFGDQNGNEAQDVLYGVSAALRRYLWLDHDRVGVEGVSYGGQLSAWLVTQTSQFKAAIPIAGITNLVSYNYMTYYNQYEQMEFGIFPHQGNLLDVLWERSALKHAANVKTPTLLMHGENDSDVPIAEAEQFYIALRDVGVETVMVRYPREGHGLREPKHIVDGIERCINWYVKHFN
jgi:dipeptidyl aminopeptidase/acylaminoacyl peptidase